MELAHLHTLFLNCESVCTDSRNISPKVLFFALKGDNFNGNTFAAEALEKGALAVVIDEPVLPPSDRVILVSNVLETLQQLANYHRKQFDIPVISITGTNGKTTTKELLQAAIQPSKPVLCTIGNLNNHIGVPLTLLRLTKQHTCAIIEMGASKQGDIHELCEIAEPTMGLITNVGKAHLGGFGNFEGVVKTKTELYRYLQTNRGIIIANASDDLLMPQIPTDLKQHTYSIDGTQATLMFQTPTSPNIHATVVYQQTTFSSQLIGNYNNLNIAAAVTIASLLNISFTDIQTGIEQYAPTNNRSELQKSGSNQIIWDAYNANPSSVALALKNLMQMDKSLQKIAILGDMNELGAFSEEEHAHVIDLVASYHIQAFYVGPHYAKQHCANHFDTVLDLKAHLLKHQLQSSFILVKGSRSIQLEKLKELFN